MAIKKFYSSSSETETIPNTSVSSENISAESPNDEFSNVNYGNDFSSDKFNEFSYSKKSHFSLFARNHFDKIFYGEEVGPERFDIKKYQNLLIFSFIQQNLPEGSRILEIGSSDDYVLNHFRYRYECWRVEDLSVLAEKDVTDNTGRKGFLLTENDKIQKELPPGYFDFIFSASGFEYFPEDRSKFRKILDNINMILKSGGYSLHCVPGAVYGIHFIYHKILNYFYNNSAPLYYNVEQLNRLPNLKKILEDTDLHYKYEEYKRSEENAMETYQNLVSFNILWKKNINELQDRTTTKPDQYFEKQQIYVFHHLMKCGGTSVKEILQDWFNTEYDYIEASENLNTFLKYKLNTGSMNADNCIVGHFQFEGIHLNQRYPEVFDNPDKYRIFTFVRDPLQFRASLYYYTRKNEIIKDYNLSQIIMNTPNLISRVFPCDENNYREVLDKYFFIGIVEKMQESFNKLADHIHKRRLKLPYANISEKDDQLSKLSPEFIAEFKKKNYLDYMIYDYCLEKFNKQ